MTSAPVLEPSTASSGGFSLDPALVRRLRPAALAPPPCPSWLPRRRDESSLTSAEHGAFIAAIQSLMEKPDSRHIGWSRFDAIVNVHADMSHRMHALSVHAHDPVAGMMRFLPWHRAYLKVFEDELRMVDPTVRIPCWDSTRRRGVPAWVADFLPSGLVKSNGMTYSVERAPKDPSMLPSPEEVHAVAALNPAYVDFTLLMEYLHNRVHNWVGGTMIDPEAPADPLFWMLHAEIDRVWHAWQLRNPTQHPVLVGADAVMDPWTMTYGDVASTHAMGYDYEETTLSSALPLP